MLNQWKVDVTVVLKFTAWFITALKNVAKETTTDIKQGTQCWTESDGEEEEDTIGARPEVSPRVAVTMTHDEGDIFQVLTNNIVECTENCNKLFWILACYTGDSEDIVNYLGDEMQGSVEPQVQPLDELQKEPTLSDLFSPKKLMSSLQVS